MRSRFSDGLLALSLSATVALCVGALAAPAALAASKKGEVVNAEGKPLVKKKFTGKGTNEVTVESTAGVKGNCKNSSSTGEMTSTTSGTATLTFSGCRQGSFGLTLCKTTGAKEAGEIVIKDVSVTDVLATGGQSSLLLFTLPKELAYECGEIKYELKGSFLMTVGSEEKAQATISFTASSSDGSPTPRKYELGGVAGTAFLERKMGKMEYEELALRYSHEVTFEEPVKFI